MPLLLDVDDLKIWFLLRLIFKPSPPLLLILLLLLFSPSKSSKCVTSLPNMNKNKTTTTIQINNATPGEYHPKDTGIVPTNKLTKNDNKVNGIIVFACSTKSHPVDYEDNTVLSANGLHVFPNVLPAKTAAADCITISSSPFDNVYANGNTSGNKIPIVPIADPAEKLTILLYKTKWMTKKKTNTHSVYYICCVSIHIK